MRSDLVQNTELQRKIRLHVVCSRRATPPRIAQQSYLLVTEGNFANAAVMVKVMVEMNGYPLRKWSKRVDQLFPLRKVHLIGLIQRNQSFLT